MQIVSGTGTTWCWVKNMDASLAFYEGVLGLEFDIKSQYWSQFVVSGQTFGLHPGAKGESQGGWILGLEVSDIKSAKDHLIAGNVLIYEDFHQTPGGVVLTILDPDNNQIQLIQRGLKL